jgi:WD40 repeat protein
LAEASAANPYPGPRPFVAGETLYGRDREVTRLFYLLSAERIVVLHSPSGAGKSSLLNAGLVPRLRGERFYPWPTIRLSQPAANGGNRLVGSAIASLEDGLPERLRRPAEELAGVTLAEYVAGRPRRPGAPASVVLVFDQFEEVLTLDPLEVEARREFFQQLGEALENPEVWALFALREDYLGALDPYRDEVPTRLGNTFRIDLLTREAAVEAITQPAHDAGRDFAPDAADRLTEDLATVSVQLPDGSFEKRTGIYVEPVQLQVVCRKLWDDLPWDDLSAEALTIGIEDLQDAGDVDVALGHYYDSRLAEIARDDLPTERRLRAWFGERLITPGGIRSSVLREHETSGGLDNDSIDRLLDTHLVRSEQRSGATWYELAHDRLVGPVRDSNKAWLDTNLSPMQRQATLWSEEDEPPSLLLRGRDLKAAEKWAREHPASVLDVERKLLARSRKQRRTSRLKLGALLLATVVLSSLAVLLGYLYVDGRHARQAESRALAVQALRSLDSDTFRGLELAERAWNVWGTSQAEGALRAALAADLRRELHPVALTAAGFDPDDGEVVVTADADGVVRVWNADRGESVHFLIRHLFRIYSLAFSHDGERFVTAGADGAAVIWDTASGEVLHVLEGDGGKVYGASFSPNDELVVTAHDDGTARIWDAPSGVELVDRRLEGHEGRVNRASFSPDGRLVVTAGVDGTARIWDADSGKETHKFEGHGGEVHRAVFSPNDAFVVTAHDDGVARIWDAASGEKKHELERHEGPVVDAGFDPDSTLVVTAGDDGTARIWDAASGEEKHKLVGHEGTVNRATISPDGDLVVTAGADGTARIWDARSGDEVRTLEGHTDRVLNAAFSSDGRRVVTTSADGTARVWDVGSGTSLRVLGEGVRRPVFSPNRQLVGTLSDDGTTARIWYRGGKGSIPFTGLTGAAKSLAFSGDGNQFVIASDDGTARIWSLDSPATRWTLEPHEKSVPLYWAAFVRGDDPLVSNADAENAFVVTAGDDGKARIWDVRKQVEHPGEPVVTLEGRTGPGGGVAISDDGKHFLTVTPNGMARLWECNDDVCELPFGELLARVKERLAENR